MISDEEITQFFRNKLEIPGVFGGKRSLQIFRGKLLRLVDNMPPGGCTRHKMVFDQTGIIPEFCFGCYKVQIAPRTVVELFKLFMIFEKIVLPSDNSRKCMVEGRADCAGAYKGFIYCSGIEEGKEVCGILQETVADNMSPDVPVTLKRGCSEFSQVYPQYGQVKPDAEMMKYPQDWKVHEDFVDQTFSWPPFLDAEGANVNAGANRVYPPGEIFAMQYWLRYAATIGDLSYLEISGKTLPLLPQLKRPPFTFPGL